MNEEFNNNTEEVMDETELCTEDVYDEEIDDEDEDDYEVADLPVVTESQGSNGVAIAATIGGVAAGLTVGYFLLKKRMDKYVNGEKEAKTTFGKMLVASAKVHREEKDKKAAAKKSASDDDKKVERGPEGN